MRCPKCQSLDNKVMDSRYRTEGNVIRRRRECLDCAHRFTTYERIDESFPMVIKKDGRREKFNRDKIASGVIKACEKRPISVEQMESAVDEILNQVRAAGEREISGHDLGEMVVKKLHEIDDVAYVRFASVYREFKDANQFMAELEDLLKAKTKGKAK
jgi:transcriptional repressor NrdR